MSHSNVFHVEQTIEAAMRELEPGHAASLVRYFDQDTFRSFCKAGFDSVVTKPNDNTQTDRINFEQACRATFIGLKSLTTPLPHLKDVKWVYSEVLHAELVKELWQEVDVDKSNSLDFEEFILLTKLVWLSALKQMHGTKRVRGEHRELGREIVNEYFDLLCSSVGGLSHVADLRKLFERSQFEFECAKVFQELEAEENNNNNHQKKEEKGSIKLDIAKILSVFDKIASHFPEDRPKERKEDSHNNNNNNNNNNNKQFALPSPLHSSTNNSSSASFLIPPPSSPVILHLNSPPLSPLASPLASPLKRTKESPTFSPRRVSLDTPHSARIGIHSPHKILKINSTLSTTEKNTLSSSLHASASIIISILVL